jgi:polysaccharide deacetylase family protein (PEP-CTERM system associated)
MENTSFNPKQPNNILTIIIEDYFQVGSFQHLIPKEYWGRFESRLNRNVCTALDLLDKNGSTATFFVCGWIAQNHPEIVKHIASKGHDIACQGYFHHNVEDLSASEFVKDVQRSKSALERALGHEVYGFRMARGWLKPSQLWLLQELADLGFKYDSSLCRQGFNFAFRPEWGEIHQHLLEGSKLIEVPVSSASFGGWSVPIAGGNYWRQFPLWLFNRWIKKWMNSHQQPLVSYFHIWELDPEQPIISAASSLQKIRHYRNLATMKDKVQHYLQRYSFTSIEQYLQFPKPVKITEKYQHCNSTSKNSKVLEVCDLTLVIPCYNEQQTLSYLKNTLYRFSQSNKDTLNLHYIFIDDGSNDNTWNCLQNLFAEQNQTRIIQHQENQGIAAALITGFAEVHTELLAVLDADCTFSPEQLTYMLALMTDNVDVVSASPMHSQGSMRNVAYWRQSLSKGAALLHSLVLHHKLTSYTSCFRLYRQHTIKDMTVSNPGFCGVTEILAKIDLAGYHIVEYPAVLEVRLLGASKINVFTTMLEHIQLVIKLARMRISGKVPKIDLVDEDEHRVE